MPPENGNGAIRVPIKEWLQRIDTKLESIDLKLDQKADRERVHDISNRVAALELTTAVRAELIAEFRTMQSDVDRLRTWRNTFGGGLTVLVFLVGANAARVWFGVG